MIHTEIQDAQLDAKAQCKGSSFANLAVTNPQGKISYIPTSGNFPEESQNQSTPMHILNTFH
jgi:hypothetical protein